MNKFFLSSCLALAFTAVLPAAVVNCASNQNINSGSTVVSCAGVTADPGFVITGITLIGLGSWQDSSIPAFVGSSSYSFTENSASFNAGPLFGTAAGSTTADTGLLFDGPVTVNLASLPAFTVDVTRTILTGGIPANATVTVSYDWTQTALPSNGDIPEPATVGLIGAGLVALAVIRRRK